MQVIARGKKFLVEHDESWPPFRKAATITIHDQHYQDENNDWQPVEEVLEADGLDGFVAQGRKINHRIRFGSGGNRRWYPRRNVTTEYIDASKPDYYDSGHWHNWLLPSFQQLANGFNFENADYQLQITFNWREAKVLYILKTANAPTYIRFPLTFTGLTLDGWNIMSGTQKVAVIQPPTVHDASQVQLPVTAAFVDGCYEMNIQSNGNFPITLDPTFDSQPDEANSIDTFIWALNPTTAYSTDIDLKIKTETTGVCRTLLGFDLSSADQINGEFIESATLYLYDTYNDAAGEGSPASIYENTRLANESATWNTWNGINNWTTPGGDYDGGSPVATFSAVNPAPGLCTISLDTLFVANKWGSGVPLAMIVRADTESPTYAKVCFCSSTVTTEANRPRLYIVYGTRPFIRGTYDSGTWNGAVGQKTVTISYQTGDVIAILSGSEGYFTDNDPGLPTASGLNFNSQEHIAAVQSAAPCAMRISTAVATSPGTNVVVTVPISGTCYWGFICWVIGDVNTNNPIGHHTSQHTNVPKTALTSIQANSIILWGVFDYAAGTPRNDSPAATHTYIENVSSGRYGYYVYDLVTQPSTNPVDYGVDGNEGAGPWSIGVLEIRGISNQTDIIGSTPAYLYGKEQYLKPDGTTANQNFKKEDNGTTTLEVSLDELYAPNDSDYVWRDGAVSGDYFEVSLANPTKTPIAGGTVLVTWRGYDPGGANTQVVVELRQGATVIASMTQNLSGTITTYTFALTEGERANISDWNDLRIRVRVP